MKQPSYTNIRRVGLATVSTTEPLKYYPVAQPAYNPGSKAKVAIVPLWGLPT